MEVFKFDLEFEKKWYKLWEYKAKVKEILEKNIKSRSENKDDFIAEWNRYQVENKDIHALANPEQLMYCNLKAKFQYFIFQKTNKFSDNKKNFTVEVIVTTSTEINPTLKEVIKDIYSFVGLKIVNLLDNRLKIYPIDSVKDDIQDIAINITTKITKNSLELSDKITFFFSVILIVSGGMSFLIKSDENLELIKWLDKFLMSGGLMIIIPSIKWIIYRFYTDYGIKVISAVNTQAKHTSGLPEEEAFTTPNMD